MTNMEIANSISHKLFADRSSIGEAWRDAFEMINRMREPEAHRIDSDDDNAQYYRKRNS